MGSAAAVALVALAVTSPAAPAQEDTTPIVVDVTRELGPVNAHLVGLGWHEGGAPLASVEDLDPHLVRVDASLQEVSSGPDDPLDLAPLLERIGEIRSIGGEPLVILSYLPAWLGEDRAFGRDPTRVRPSDLDAWQALVHEVVHALATAPEPALVFEAWNEPDVPLFWQDTPVAWLDTVERSARAVAAVEEETGLDLRFGGPATAVPNPTYLVPFLERFRDPSLPLDFVSWHYYGNYPFFGPDGAEFPITEPIQPILGQENPFTSPAAYGPQVDFVRTIVDVTLAGTDRPRPALILDEWNLSAAGFDRRHDTAAGAAFAAGVLIEMQEAGLDAAAYFRANDTRGVPGEHGLVRTDGTRKPVWWTFRLFQQLAPTRVAVESVRPITEGTWSLASTDGRRVTLLLVRFRADRAGAPPAPLRVGVSGATVGTATVVRIDDDHPAPGAHEPLVVQDGIVDVPLPEPGVALVELAVAPATTADAAPGTDQAGRPEPTATGRPDPTAARGTLPVTGGSSTTGSTVAAALIGGAALLLSVRRRTTRARHGHEPDRAGHGH